MDPKDYEMDVKSIEISKVKVYIIIGELYLPKKFTQRTLVFGLNGSNN